VLIAAGRGSAIPNSSGTKRRERNRNIFMLFRQQPLHCEQRRGWGVRLRIDAPQPIDQNPIKFCSAIQHVKKTILSMSKFLPL
jgi:hypothetical protein